MKNIFKINRLSFILVFSFVSSVFGQENSGVVPPSPEAEAFKIFGDYPVSYYTGLPEILIPIYTIEVDGVKIPIRLRYHASGLKVNQTASCVGLGWTLEASGILSRTINGVPDEDLDGFLDDTKGYKIYPKSLNNPKYYENPFNYASNIVELPYLTDVAGQVKDAESDSYSINFLDMNVNFVFDTLGHPQCYPLSNLDISCNSGLTQWVVVDSKGTKYYFEESEEIKTIYKNSGSGFTPQNKESALNHSSGWYITKIITPHGQKIDYKYGGVNRCVSIQTSESLTYLDLNSAQYDDNTSTFHSYCQTEIEYLVPSLSKISFPGGEIDFCKSSKWREDIEKESHALNSIKIKDDDLNLVKEIAFNYDYFVSDNIRNATDTFYYKRLKLEGVDQISKSEEEKHSTTFSYYEDKKLPNIRSHAQDCWGFYNGKTANDNHMYKFIPDDKYLQYTTNIEHTYEGADRRPCFPEMEAWTLTQINYPTGGTTVFEYEPHKYYVTPSSYEYETSETATYTFTNESKTSEIEAVGWTYYEDKFTVPGISGRDAKTTIKLNLAAPTGGRKSHKIYIIEAGSNDAILTTKYSGDAKVFTSNVMLISGLTYKVLIQSNLKMPDVVTITTNFLEKKTVGLDDIGTAGGLRIHKIKNYTDRTNTAFVRKFLYTKKDATTSSGLFANNLTFYSHFGLKSPGTSSTQIFGSYGDDCIIQESGENFTSYSTNGLETTCGSSVGYSRVEEIKGYEKNDIFYKGIGKTVYHYTTKVSNSNCIAEADISGYMNAQAIPVESINKIPENFWIVVKSLNTIWGNKYLFPNINTMTKFWAEGLLLSQIDYNANGKKVKEIDNSYCRLNRRIIGKGLKASILPYGYYWSYNNGKYYHITQNASYKSYVINSDKLLLSKNIEKLFTSNDSIILRTTYEYDSTYYQKKKITFESSKGEAIVKSYYYPFDINKTVYANMVNSNMINYPIEIVQSKNGKITNGTLHTYKIDNNKIVPSKVYKTENTELLSSMDYFDGLKMDSNYGDNPEAVFSSYDDYGNPTKIESKSGVYTYYLWGYNHQYPVAKIESSINNTTIPTITVVDSKISRSYLKSLLSDYINNNAYQVTYYTYKSLVGMTSQTDPNGVTTYYEYDDFGRLQTEKDDDGNIINQYDYHYAE